MTVRTFYLPNGNQIEIVDRGPNGWPNGVLDRSDLIRINHHAYTLHEVERFPEPPPMTPRPLPASPTRETPTPHGFSFGLPITLGITAPPQPLSAPTPRSDPAGSWHYLLRILGVHSLSGVNLSQADGVFRLREQARYLLTPSNPTAEQRAMAQSFINVSNELGRSAGFSSITDEDLHGLSFSLPARAFPRWSALDCFRHSAAVFCRRGDSLSEEAQIQAAQDGRLIEAIDY